MDTSICLAELGRSTPQDARFKALFQRGANEKLDSCLETFTHADHTEAQALMAVDGLRDVAQGLRETVQATTASLQAMHEQNQSRFTAQLQPGTEEKLNFGARTETESYQRQGFSRVRTLRRVHGAEVLTTGKPSFKDVETDKPVYVNADHQSLPTNYPQKSFEPLALAVDDLVTFFSTLSNVPAPLAATLSVAGIRSLMEIKDHLGKMLSLAPGEAKLSASRSLEEFSGKKQLAWRNHGYATCYLGSQRELGSATVSPALVYLPAFTAPPKPWHAIEMSVSTATKA